MPRVVLCMLTAASLTVVAAPLPAAPVAEIPAPIEPAPKAITAEPESAAKIELVRIRITGVVNLQNRQVHRYMNVEGQVTLDDDVDIIGVTYQAVVTEALDEEGRDLLVDVRDEIEMMRLNRAYNGVGPRGGADRTIRLAAAVRSMPRLPSRLSRLRGQTKVLVADRRANVDINPVAPGRLIEVHSGMRVQITDARHDPGRLTVTFDFEATDPNPFYNLNGEAPFVITTELIDDQGNVIQQQGLQPNIRSIEQGVARGEAKLMFPLPEGRRAQSLRFDVVTRVSERALRFDVRNIKLPGAEPDPAEADKPAEPADPAPPVDAKLDPPVRGEVRIDPPVAKPDAEPRVQE